MTNVSGTPKKRATRRGLFAFAVQALEKQGWTVTRVPRGGKASLLLLPDAGLRGNSHFMFQDLNNVQVADQLSAFLVKYGLHAR